MEFSLTMFFWIMLSIGLLVSLKSLFTDDFMASVGLDTWGTSMFFTGFGGAGLILKMFIDNDIMVLLLSTLVGLLSYIIIYFFIAPKIKNDASIAISVHDLKGLKGKVTVTIPKDGYGQVRLHEGVSYETRPGKSYDESVIEQGTEIVVIDVINGVVHVTEVAKEKL